ncbi:MAG TPA: DUF4288 domain-containing protein [Verrucomicrobiae bacterium]
MKAPKTIKPPVMAVKRFAAKLLFQFRVIVNGDSGVRRICECQIIQFGSTNASSALREAKLRAIKKQHNFKNSDGNLVRFEFVGVQELLCLDPVCDSDEVWYEIFDRVKPMERRLKFVPLEKKLNAIRNRD